MRIVLNPIGPIVRRHLPRFYYNYTSYNNSKKILVYLDNISNKIRIRIYINSLSKFLYIYLNNLNRFKIETVIRVF